MPDEAALQAELTRILEADAIASVYQPIVDLETGEPVAYEALARGPQGSPLQTPGALFGAAGRSGRLAELDWACRAAALRGAIGTGLERPMALFVNLEPVAAAAGVPARHQPIVDTALERLRVVFEFTERELTERPREVFATVRTLRELGVAIALDDVGVDPRSLALMPYVRPDVIKLDMTLVQDRPSLAMADTMHAVNAYAEESGALILAEGIETEEHLQRARALGAGYGQGWYFGRPGVAPTTPAAGAPLPRLRHAAQHVPGQHGETPFDLLAELGLEQRVADKQLLLMMSRQLERQAESLGEACVVIANLQHERHLSRSTQRIYTKLSEHAAFVGLIGQDVPVTPAPGVRGGALEDGDRIASEWTVCVTSPHFAAAMIATDLGDDGPDLERRFAYRLTYDRTTVVRAARMMMSRIAPSGA